jgi:hypothetical protein
VPFALTPKSVWGSPAAQSWDGCAAAWTTISIEPALSLNTRSTAPASRMSISSERKSGYLSRIWPVTCVVEASGPKKLARMSFSRPTTSNPASASSRATPSRTSTASSASTTRTGSPP